MKVVIWILHVLLTIAFLMVGVMKLITPYDQLIVTEGTFWAEDFSAMQVQIISVLELLGALGLILPLLLKKMKKLVPIAAFSLGAVMVGGIITHIGRGEPVVINVVLLIIALLVGYFRRDMLKA